MTKGSQIPGALPSPNSISVQHVQPVVMHHEHAVVHAQVVHAHEPVAQHVAAPAPESLEVSILQANNLASLNKFTGDSMAVTCQVVHRTGNVLAHGHTPTIQSSTADPAQSPDPLNP